MMPMVSSMAPSHSLGQGNQIEIKHDFFGHVMSLELALVLHDAIGVINGTITFLRSRQSN